LVCAARSSSRSSTPRQMTTVDPPNPGCPASGGSSSGVRATQRLTVRVRVTLCPCASVTVYCSVTSRRSHQWQPRMTFPPGVFTELMHR
jgi:hypothetical protein